jgi:hypothetical protein
VCAVIAVALALGAAPVAGGAANAPADPRSERDRVRREAAANAAQVDALQADQAAVSQALATLAANVAAEEARLADAQQAAAQARVAADQARVRADAAAEELTAMADRVRDLAVQAYIGRGEDDAGGLLLGGDVTEAMLRRELLQLRQGSQADAIDRLRAAREDLDIAHAEAETASRRADDHEAAVARQLSNLQTARDQQAAVLNGVEARLNAALAESAALAHLDAQLSAQIARQEAELAARARAAGSGGGGGGGGGWAPPSGPISLATVRGITVNAAIAGQLESMLAAAAADGFSFGGGGYRSPEDQWRLRRAHCPDPANSPPSACSPPTALPGYSMHERGLAIDFTYNGRLISSRSNPGYVWLANHAGGYGFHNLPSEPWHWSTTGQ